MIRVDRKCLDEAVQATMKLAMTATDTVGLKLGAVDHNSIGLVANMLMAIVGILHEQNGDGVSVMPSDCYEAIHVPGQSFRWPPELPDEKLERHMPKA